MYRTNRYLDICCACPGQSLYRSLTKSCVFVVCEIRPTHTNTRNISLPITMSEPRSINVCVGESLMLHADAQSGMPKSQTRSQRVKLTICRSLDHIDKHAETTGYQVLKGNAKLHLAQITGWRLHISERCYEFQSTSTDIPVLIYQY